MDLPALKTQTRWLPLTVTVSQARAGALQVWARSLEHLCVGGRSDSHLTGTLKNGLPDFYVLVGRLGVPSHLPQ